MNAAVPPVDRLRRLVLRRALAAALTGLVARMPAVVSSAEASANPAVVPARHSEVRRAVVFGMGRYAEMPLRSAVADARLVADSLRALGFTVDLFEDLGLARMLEALRNFIDAAQAADVRLVYFAGHGAQYRGRNFLLPVDTHLNSEDDLPGQAVDAHEFAERLSQFETGVNLIFLDACRAAPVRASGLHARGVDSGHSGGLTPMVAPRGTVVVYATAPDKLAYDSSEAGHSPFTRHLVENWSVAGLPIEVMLKRVRAGVMQDTGNRQVPWDSSSLLGDFCLKSDPRLACGDYRGGAGTIDLAKP